MLKKVHKETVAMHVSNHSCYCDSSLSEVFLHSLGTKFWKIKNSGGNPEKSENLVPFTAKENPVLVQILKKENNSPLAFFVTSYFCCSDAPLSVCGVVFLHQEGRKVIKCIRK